MRKKSLQSAWQIHYYCCFDFKISYTTSQKLLNSKILKKSLLLTKPAFIWSKVQQKQHNFEIFLLFKPTVFYVNIC